MKPHRYRRAGSLVLIWALLLVSILPAIAAHPTTREKLPLREQALPGWFSLPATAGNLPPLPPDADASLRLWRSPKVVALFHRTTAEAAKQIVAHGFRDAESKQRVVAWRLAV